MKAQKLQNYAEFVMGQAPPGELCNFDGDGTVFVKAGEFAEEYPQVREWTKKPLKFATKDDVLVCVVGATAGKVNKGIDCAIGRSVAAVRPNPNKLDKTFLYYLLSRNTERLRNRSQGAAQGVITREMLADIDLPAFPLEEQKRIAAILDKANSIRRKRAESLRLLNDFLRATFLDMFGDPSINPKRWPIKRLADVVAPETIVTYGIVQAGPEFPGGVPYIRTGDIKNGVILEERLLRTSPEIASKFKRSEVNAGDLVMSIRATVGTLALVPPSLTGANLTQGTAKISPGPDIDGKFLFSYINSESCQNWIQRHVKGATFREITLSKLREMPIFVPDRNSQEKFREICDQLEIIKKDYSNFNVEDNKFFHSLVARAFKGQL